MSLLAAINALSLVEDESPCVESWPGSEDAEGGNFKRPVWTLHNLRQEYLLCLAKLKLVPYIRGMEESGKKCCGASRLILKKNR